MQKAQRKQISNEISYIEASEHPLSADIGIVEKQNETWLYDVGNDRESICSLTGQYHVVLSHFHPDHVGNLEQLTIEKLYVSKYTHDRVGRGIIVEDDIYIDNLHIFPLPSSHAKGSLGLEVDGVYAFVGDALYCKAKAEYDTYNVQLLKEEIEVLKKLKAEYLLISHKNGMVQEKQEVIRQLEELYSHRDKASSEILVKKQREES